MVLNNYYDKECNGRFKRKYQDVYEIRREANGVKTAKFCGAPISTPGADDENMELVIHAQYVTQLMPIHHLLYSAIQSLETQTTCNNS